MFPSEKEDTQLNKPRPKHLHVFRIKKGLKPTAALTEKTFCCISPDCWFYAKAVMLVGKRAQCPRCLKPFVLDARKLNRAKPHCDDCTKSKVAESKTLEKQASLDNIEKALQNLKILPPKDEY